MRAEHMLMRLFLPELLEDLFRPLMNCEILPDLFDALGFGLHFLVIPIHYKAVVVGVDLGIFPPITRAFAVTIVAPRTIPGRVKKIGGHLVGVSVVGLLINHFNDEAFRRLFKLQHESKFFETGPCLTCDK